MSNTPTTDNSQENCKNGEIGRLLARARKQKGLDLRQASQSLKLSGSTLERIENDQFEQIPAIYRRGYVANYARLLDLDPEPLLARLPQANPEPLRAVLPAPRHNQRFDRFLRFATYALVTTMIVPPLVVFFVMGGARLFEADRNSMEGASAEAAPVGANSYRDRLADVLLTESSTETSGHLSASAMPLRPVRPPVEEVVDEAAEPAPAPEQPPVSLESVLELNLIDDSWVEVEDADGQRLEFDLLRAGQNRSYTGRAPFRLLLGRAGQVELWLDGQKVDLKDRDLAGVAELEIGASVPEPDLADSAAEVPDQG